MGDLAGFVEAGLHHVWNERVQVHMPGLSSTVRDGDVGFLTFYGDEYVKWSSIVTVNTPLSVEALNAVREINGGLPIGTVTLQPGDDGDCVTLWSYKVLPTWIDSDARISAKLVVDVTTNVPSMVRMCRQKLLPCGGQTYVPEDIGTLMFLS